MYKMNKTFRGGERGDSGGGGAETSSVAPVESWLGASFPSLYFLILYTQ